MQEINELKDSELENIIGGSTEGNGAEITPPGSDTDRHAPGDISVSAKPVPKYVIQYKHK